MTPTLIIGKEEPVLPKTPGHGSACDCALCQEYDKRMDMFRKQNAKLVERNTFLEKFDNGVCEDNARLLHENDVLRARIKTLEEAVKWHHGPTFKAPCKVCGED